MAQSTTTDITRRESPAVGSRWGGDRIKLAGYAGLVSGALLTLASFGTDTMFGPEGSLGFVAYNLATVILFALPAAAILGANAMYGDRYGWLGRVPVYALAAAFLGMAISGISFALAPAAHPLMPLADVSFLGGFVLASIVGVLFLWKTPVSRVAAGLLAITVPAFVVGIQLLSAGIVPFGPAFVLFELPMFLGVAVLGLHLLRHAPETTPADGQIE